MHNANAPQLSLRCVPTITAITPVTLLRTAITLVALSLLLMAVPGIAQETSWKDSQGNPVSETGSRKSVNGEGGWLLVTSDDDWEEKWNTPSEIIPQFTESHTVGVGKRLHILTFIANPGRAMDGTAHVTCDFGMQKPDGTFEVQKQNVVCLTGTLLGSKRTLYLSRLILGFAGDKDGPVGQWTVRVTINDSITQASIPLEAAFVMQ
jgi:hypothetical protein